MALLRSGAILFGGYDDLAGLGAEHLAGAGKQRSFKSVPAEVAAQTLELLAPLGR